MSDESKSVNPNKTNIWNTFKYKWLICDQIAKGNPFFYYRIYSSCFWSLSFPWSCSTSMPLKTTRGLGQGTAFHFCYENNTKLLNQCKKLSLWFFFFITISVNSLCSRFWVRFREFPFSSRSWSNNAGPCAEMQVLGSKNGGSRRW